MASQLGALVGALSPGLVLGLFVSLLFLCLFVLSSLFSVLCPAVSFCGLVCMTSRCNWLRPLKKKNNRNVAVEFSRCRKISDRLRGGGASSRSLSVPGWAALAKREAATRCQRCSSNPPRPSRPRWARGAEAGGGAVGELSRGQRLGQSALDETKPGRGVEEWAARRRKF